MKYGFFALSTMLMALLVFSCESPSSPAPVAATFAVTYDGNGNTGGTAPADPKVYASGASVTVLSNSGSLVRTSYTFDGWNTKADGSGTRLAPAATFAMGSSAVTLYAAWSWQKVSGLTPATGSTSTVSVPALSWSAQTDAASYEVQLSATEAGVASATAIAVSGTEWTPSTPPAGHFWYWRVRAVSSANVRGTWSDTALLAVDWDTITPTLAGPSDGTTTEDTTPTLAWTAVTAAHHYEVALATSDNGLTSATATNSSSASFVPNSALDNKTTYFWRVRALGPDGSVTAWSASQSFNVNWGASGPADGICFASELKYLSDLSWEGTAGVYLAGNLWLGADVDLAGVAMHPLGLNKWNQVTTFSGTFDGKGHTIRHLTSAAGTTYGGLIAGLGVTGVVKNLILQDVDLRADNNGGIAAQTGGEISDCTVSGHFEGSSGGITSVVLSSGAKILRCSSSGTIEGGLAGGIAEENAGTIEDCTSSMVLSGTAQTVFMGGLVAKNAQDATITRCSASGSITSTVLNGNAGSGSFGGLVGRNLGAVSLSSATGNVTVSAYRAATLYAGGFVGQSQIPMTPIGTASKCYSSGAVQINNSGGVTGTYYVGGFGEGTATDCYTRSSVALDTTLTAISGYFAGFGSGTHLRCFSTGTATGVAANCSGFSVLNNSDTGCFFDADTSGFATSITSATPKHTANMKSATTFTVAGWDLSTVWTIDETKNNGYPILKDLAPAN